MSGIITTTNSVGDCVSSWKIPLWIFTLAKLFLLLLLPLSIFFYFLDKLKEFVGYLVHFETLYYPALRDHILCLFIVNSSINTFFVSLCCPWEFDDQCIVDFPFLLFPYDIISVLQEAVCSLLANCKFL